MPHYGAGVAGVVWKRSGSTTWLSGSPEVGAGAVAAGLTVDTGLAQQDPRHLGVAALVAAWLTREVARPGEAVDGPYAGLRVTPSLGQSELTLALSGGPAAVQAGLARLAAVLPAAGAATVDEDLRARARMLGNPLSPWSAHLAARWRGSPFVLTALGPLSLDTVDPAAMAAYVAAGFGPDARLFWTTDPELTPVAPAGPGRPRDRLVLPPARTGPGCVLRRADEEVASTVADPFDPADRVALSVLAVALHRRLVEFQPLAADVELRMHPLPGRIALVTCVLVGAQGRDAEVLAAVAQTTEDLAGCGSAEIDRVRRAVAADSVAGPAPAALAALARRQLVVGDEPTPELLAAATATVTDGEVRDRLAALHRGLLLAVPAATGDLPYPLVEPVARPVPGGARFPSWGEAGVLVRCSPRSVGRVRRAPLTRTGWPPRRPAPTTLAAVDFDRVVLRIDAGQQATGLVDADLASVQLVFPAYQRGERLRAAVAARTAGVPVARVPPRPEVDAWLDQVVRRRRRARIGTVLISAVAVLGLLLAGLTAALTRQQPVRAEVAATQTVRLANGTTLALVGAPERVTRRSGFGPAQVWAVQIRMCGGGPSRGDGSASARNVLSPLKFAIVDGQRVVSATQTTLVLPDRPPLPDVDLEDGECGQGWVAFPLSGPELVDPRLRYSNLPGDRVLWRLTG